MDIGALRVRITIQKNETVVDKYGNHKAVWTDHFSCWATAVTSGLSTKEEESAGHTVEADRLDITVRWCSEIAAGSTTSCPLTRWDSNATAVNSMRSFQRGEPMGTTIRPDQLASEVMKGLEEYKDLAVDVMKKEIQNTGKTVKQQISQTAPKKSGRYAKSWAVKKVKETSNSLDVVVHSKNRYQLTHLLENGHAKRGGGRVRAIPHIGPAEEMGIRELEERIERALK